MASVAEQMLAAARDDGSNKVLMNVKADINATDAMPGRCTALHLAARDVDPQAVAVLLAAGADRGVTNGDLQVPGDKAMQTPMEALPLARQTSLHGSNVAYRQALCAVRELLDESTVLWCHEAIIAAQDGLLSACERPFVAKCRLQRALQDAILCRDETAAAKVRRMLEAGADVNATDAKGVTPLVAAARAGSAEVVRTLVAWPATHLNLAGRAPDGRMDFIAPGASRCRGTALAAAVKRRAFDVVAVLIAAGSEPRAALEAFELQLRLQGGALSPPVSPMTKSTEPETSRQNKISRRDSSEWRVSSWPAKDVRRMRQMLSRPARDPLVRSEKTRLGVCAPEESIDISSRTCAIA
jgi:ankyrin repeat protein